MTAIYKTKIFLCSKGQNFTTGHSSLKSIWLVSLLAFKISPHMNHIQGLAKKSS